MGTNVVFQRVYTKAQSHFGALIEALVKTLEHFGCGAASSRNRFESELRKVLLKIATAEEDEAPLSNVKITGSLTDKRRALIKEVLLGFGADEGDAEQMTRTILRADPNLIAELPTSGQLRIRRNPPWKQLTHQIRRLFSEAEDLHERLAETLTEIRRGYRGSTRDPEEGVEQVVELLERFPDVADPIYQAAGLTGLTNFPPERKGPMNSDAHVFKAEVQEYLDSEWWWNAFKIAGLVVAAIAVTVITAGTLGPLAATLTGAGIGLVQGGVHVYGASERLQELEDAHLYGAASDGRVQHARGEVKGAWGMLVVNVVTAGALGKFGGGPALSNLMRGARVTAISAAGGGIGVATNPNVWEAENTASLILFGTLIGGGAGAGGHALASGASKLVPALGARIQVGVTRSQGALQKGNTVTVQLKPNAKPVSAKVVSVNTRDNTVMLKVDGQNLHVRVGTLAKVNPNMYDAQFRKAGFRTPKATDFGSDPAEAVLVQQGNPTPGTVSRNTAGDLVFTDAVSKQTSTVRLGQLKVYDAKLHAQAAGVKLKDLNGFRDGFGEVDRWFDLRPVAGNSGYFAATPRQQFGNRLSIVAGARRDHNGAFKGWAHERLPGFDMRGRGPAPAPDEVALFMAHGAPTGFSGIGTRKAARTVVDAIVTANRQASLSGAGKAPIRFCSLSSCSQGTRRFLVLGKTNAEAFQDAVDTRLLELGINPRGPQGITVLAADRMGSIYGADQVKVFGKFQTTKFVPAGTQRPLSYGADVAQAGVKVVGFVAASGGAGGLMVVTMKAIQDPEAAMQWIQQNKDKILGWIFESEDKGPTQPLQLNPSRGR
jgi:hypothetical protein